MTENSSDPKLAIVIPAYKGDYLAKTLACLVRQTDQRFNLYICDDASPADIQGIARSALGTRPYIYKRFETNLGGKSIARHWNRCVTQVSESWVWTFSDDDLMDDNCVEAFYKSVESDSETANVLCFGLWVVDEDDKITAPVTIDLGQETWLEFAYSNLMGWCTTCVQNLIFRRSAFEKVGGFLDLPLGWRSDSATVIAVGRFGTIRQVRGPRVLWRSSRQHISSDSSFQAMNKKLQAACLFLQWFHDQLRTPREYLFAGDDAAFRSAMDRFLIQQIMNVGPLPALANWNLISSTRAEICQGSRLALLKYITLAAINDGLSVPGKAANMLMGKSGT